MSRKVVTFSIPGLREGDATYSEYTVPNVRELLNLDGGWEWTMIPIAVKKTAWETFVANPELWTLVESPTSCYVDISPEQGGRIVFYRDQQDCIIWSVDSGSGKIYSSCREEPVADDIEEFWARVCIEAQLWYMYAWHNIKELPKDPVLRKYSEFYLQPVPEWGLGSGNDAEN